MNAVVFMMRDTITGEVVPCIISTAALTRLALIPLQWLAIFGSAMRRFESSLPSHAPPMSQAAQMSEPRELQGRRPCLAPWRRR